MPFYKNSNTVNKSIEYVEESDGEHYKLDIHKTNKFRKNSKFADGGVPAIDSFYFRISGANIYYTETAEDTVVLGAIAIKNVHKVDKSKAIGEDKCFVV